MNNSPPDLTCPVSVLGCLTDEILTIIVDPGQGLADGGIVTAVAIDY